MEPLHSSKAEQIKKIREIANVLILEKKVKKNQLANYLGLQKRQHSSFYKFIYGNPFPKFLEPTVNNILENLAILLESSEPVQRLHQFSMGIGNNGQEKTPISHLLWIPFDLKLPVTEYNGAYSPPSIIAIGTKKGIVTFRSNSKYHAEGEIPIDHIGMATDIDPGTSICIKRINKTDWQTDRYYMIIDASDQISIRELIPGDDKSLRYASQSNSEGPHKPIPLERIIAMFGIVEGRYIPKPKRNKSFATGNVEMPLSPQVS